MKGTTKVTKTVPFSKYYNIFKGIPEKYYAVEKSAKIIKIIKTFLFNIINFVYVIYYLSKYNH